MGHEFVKRCHYLGSTNPLLKKWTQNRDLKGQSRIPLVGADVLIASCSNTGVCLQKPLSKLMGNFQLVYLYAAVIQTIVLDFGVVNWIMNFIAVIPNSNLTIPCWVTRETLERNINLNHVFENKFCSTSHMLRRIETTQPRKLNYFRDLRQCHWYHINRFC
jgi:hypothetical protein